MKAAAASPRRTLRRRLDRDTRREAILVAASSVFAAKGYTAASMADLADAAGVSHLIIYRHFESKDDLYETVLRRARGNLDATCTPPAIGQYGPTAADLLTAARTDPAAFTVLWRHAAREERFRHHAADARRHLERLTARALRPIVPRADVRWAARATVAYLVEAVLVWIEDGDSARDSRFVTATQAALRAGVRSWAAANRGTKTDGT